MFRRLWALALTLAAGAAVVLVAGCGGGVDRKSLDDMQKRIDLLRSKGVPLDKLTEARVFLGEAVANLEKRNNAPAKKATDSARVYLVKAEAFYQQEVAGLGPKIDAAKGSAIKAKDELSGYQVKKIDSIVGVVDSLRKIDWLLQSNNVAQDLLKLVPFLKEDENKARKIMGKLPGEWVFTEKDKSVEFPIVNAVTTKIFKFGDTKGRSVHLLEKKFGYSGGYLHEDWEFQSWGKYDFKGDTIMLEISRFKIAKQMFKRLHKVDGKDVWKEEPQPTYDTLITDKSQDRSVTYEDLTVDFKKR